MGVQGITAFTGFHSAAAGRFRPGSAPCFGKQKRVDFTHKAPEIGIKLSNVQNTVNKTNLIIILLYVTLVKILRFIQ